MMLLTISTDTWPIDMPVKLPSTVYQGPSLGRIIG
jgi:hypothetical protein